MSGTPAPRVARRRGVAISMEGHRALLRAAPCLLALALALLLVCASRASAHAQLLGTSPASGATVSAQPSEVIFKFNQDVGGTAGAVRVYDSQGNEVDNLEVSHPDGNEHWMGVGLKSKLLDGTYTATYRVVSADTHIVYGGLVFNLGHPSASSKITVAGLIARDQSGEVTRIAVGVVRALNYVTLALMAGGLLFMLLIWPRALADNTSGETRWGEATSSFAERLNLLLGGAVLVGVLVSVLGVLLQGASAAGVSLWASLKSSIVQSTLESRFGWVWGIRAVVWLALGLILVVSRGARRRAWLSAALSTHDGDDDARDGVRARSSSAGTGWVLVAGALVLGTAYLLVTPALAGHASIESPVGVFFPSDVIHVAAASVWVGGIACLLVVLPTATRRLESAERSRLLLATLARFSPLALGAVVAIAITGVIQAYIDVRSLHALLNTTYGALIIAKTLLLLALIGFGWVNRRRVIPALQRIVATSSAPGGVGRMARSAMRGELALMLCVFGVTAALISYAPPIDVANGPFSENTTIGPALLEMTVEPAKVGLNTIHLYLIDAKTGAQYTATKELTATAKLPSKGIGPLPLHATPAGPGHYIFNSTVLSPSGTWRIEIVDRVSEFEQYTRIVQVPIG